MSTGVSMTEIAELIKTFGYPVAISIYLLWRYDRMLSVAARQQQILDNQNEIKDVLSDIRDVIKGCPQRGA